MSKNTGDSRFRRVDVDLLDEDNYKEDEQATDESSGPDEGEVTSLLNSNKSIEALRVILDCAPVRSKDQAVKDRALGLFLRVVTSSKSSDVDEGVKNLNKEQLDTLMKYIYRGFEGTTDNNSASLLMWHEKVFAAAGVGSIVRVLTDRKKV